MVTLSGFSTGDTAIYTCSVSFELVGDPVLHCQDDGTWDNPPPACEGVTGRVLYHKIYLVLHYTNIWWLV